MHAFIAPPKLRPDNMSNDALQAGIIDLGLATCWTAFVAVSEKIYNANSDASKEADVALPMVAGITKNAYPRATGYGTPEPGMWLGLRTALFTLAAFRRWRRRSATLGLRNAPC
jgi:hypothetical protein